MRGPARPGILGPVGDSPGPSPGDEDRARRRRQLRERLLPWALLLGVAFLLYAATLGYPLTGFDDVVYYGMNPALQQGWHALVAVWQQPFFADYAPVTQLTFLADLHAHPHVLVAARLQQLTWLGIGAVACERLCWRLTGDRGLALVVALAYVVHPVCGESAMWLAERKNLVALALALWSIERHIAWRQGAGWGAAIASLVLCPLALLAKAHAIIIPAVIAAYELLLAPGSARQRLRAVLPLGLLTAAFVLCCLHVLHLYRTVPTDQVGGSLAASLWCDGAVFARYLAHVVLPQHLALFYAINEDPRQWPLLLGGWLVVVGVVALTIALARQRRTALFAWCAAGAAILPTSNLKPLPMPMADHYLQWSLPWLLLAFALALRRLVEGRPLPAADPALAPPPAGPAPDGTPVGRAAVPLAAGILVFLTLLAIARLPTFRTPLALFQAATRDQPGCGIGWGRLCLLLAEQGDEAAAGQAGLRALRCPDAHRIFQGAYVAALEEGIPACRAREGDAAAEQLLAARLPALPPALHPVVRGVVALHEDRLAEAQAALAPLCTPAVAGAAQQLAQACAAQQAQPWDLPPAALVRPGIDDDQATASLGYLLAGLTALAQTKLQTQQQDSAAALLGLVLNLHPQDLPAARLYRQACLALGRTQAVERVDRELLRTTTPPAAPAPGDPVR